MRYFWAYDNKTLRVLSGSSANKVSGKVSNEVSGDIGDVIFAKTSPHTETYALDHSIYAQEKKGCTYIWFGGVYVYRGGVRVYDP